MTMSSRVLTTLGVVLCALAVTVAAAAAAAPVTAATTAQANPQLHPQQSQPPVEGEVDIDPGDLSGDGSESNPYEISNVSELQAMEDDLDANYELVSDIDASQTAQFNDGAGFDPVGAPGFGENTLPPFTGTFDGNNNTITGLTVTRPGESLIGLFGVTDGATLSNVTLQNMTVTGDSFVGGLVGNINRGTIQNARASGSVTGDSEVGGLVGFNDGNITTATASGNVNGTDDVGGLVGDNRRNITTATASGSVTGDSEVGGLVGFNDGNITTATASGNVNGTDDVGGLVGDNDGTIRESFAVGSVTGDRNVGGLVGKNTVRVEQSYFDTQATGLSTSAGSATGLTTAEMQGQAAAENMALAFGETWQTVAGDYPELIALADSDSGSPTIVDEFDTDGNGDISIIELGQAGQAFASGEISITELGEVGAAFAS